MLPKNPALVGPTCTTPAVTVVGTGALTAAMTYKYFHLLG